MKSHKSEVAITLQPARKQCRLSPEIKCMGVQAAAQNNPLLQGHWGREDMCWPSTQVLTTLHARAIKLLPNQKREIKKG